MNHRANAVHEARHHFRDQIEKLSAEVQRLRGVSMSTGIAAESVPRLRAANERLRAENTRLRAERAEPLPPA